MHLNALFSIVADKASIPWNTLITPIANVTFNAFGSSSSS
jgi:hypothetical protein